MAEPTRLDRVSSQNEQHGAESERKPTFQRLENEPALWHRCFKIFRSLGVKRTLLAALLKEQEKAKVLKGTPPAPQSADTSKKRQKTSNDARALTPLPKVQPTQVPGSWKRASIQWNWVERAEAYDEYRIDKMVEAMMVDYLDGASLAFNRVQMLKGLYQTVMQDFTTHNRQMTFDQHIAYYTRMQALLKQIADEMTPFDESVQRVLLRGLATKQYREWTPPGDEKAKAEVLADQLSAKAGGDDRLLAMIEDIDRKQAAQQQRK